MGRLETTPVLVNRSFSAKIAGIRVFSRKPRRGMLPQRVALWRMEVQLMPEPIVIATWPFGQTAARIALQMLEKDQPALDSALAGAQAVEDDPKVNSVGY